MCVGNDVPADDRFGDIEEALAELFDAESLLGDLTLTALPEAEVAVQKIKRACHLLDRPWS